MRYDRSPDETTRLAHWAGAVYLSLGIAALFGYYHAPLVHGDLDAIRRLIVAPEGRFRIGVVADVLSTALGVPLALLLYQLFKQVHKTQAALMALLLLVAIPMSFAGALNYVAAQSLLTAPDMLPAQRDALATLFLRLHTHVVLAEEIFWGLWLLPFGALVMRSRFLPRVLGVLLIIGGIAYVAHSVTSLLLGGQRIMAYERVTMLARAAGEFPIMLWLTIRGARRAPRNGERGADEDGGAGVPRLGSSPPRHT